MNLLPSLHLNWRKSLAIGALLTALVPCISAQAAPPPDFWNFATPQQLPFDVEMLSEKEENGLVWKEFYFTSEVVNGEKYRIYSLYAAPKGATKVPAVLFIHGAGGTAERDVVEAWAKRGYACLSYDWWGNPKDKKLGRPQYSRFGAGTDLETTKFQFTSPPKDSRTYHGLIAARRAISWMQAQPEVDGSKIGVHGVSWGGLHSLILSGMDERVKAAVTIYGAGFYQSIGINDGVFGLTGPLKFLPNKEQQQAWLDTFDPQHYIQSKTPRFLMTGTNDIFFWLPLVQKTYEAIPGDKRLWLEPNINHSIHSRFKEPMFTAAKQWFDFQLSGQGEALPTVSSVTLAGSKASFTVSPTEKATKATIQFLWLQKKPLGTRLSGPYNNKDTVWQAAAAQKTAAGQWEATLPAPPADALGVDVFANITTADGVTLSSPVTELELAPKP